MIFSRKSMPLRMAAAILCLAVAGCGGKSRGMVAGKVTCDGQPVAEGQVVFCDPEDGFYVTQRLGPDGTYNVRTPNGPGLPTGKWEVAIAPPRVDPPRPGEPPPVIRDYPNIPLRYRDPKTSGFSIEVRESNGPYDFEIKRK
jgi:hypothetical protein